MAQIEVTGNAGGDAELKYIKGAKGEFAIANLSLAETPREYKNGEWISGETVWWKVSATGELAEALADMALKGVKLLVKGDLKAFEYTGRDGNVKQGFEIRAKSVSSVISSKPKSAQPKQTGDNSWPF
jgi:single-strand DNA-binding protein